MLKIQPESIVIHAYYDGHVIRTAAVSTIGSFAMASGVVLARIKACFKAPLRTAIWLQSPANKASHGKIGAGREIDIAEIYTSRMPLAPAEVAHNIHSGGYGEMHQHTGSPTSKVHACQYHNYKAEFGEFGYKFYVDGELQWQTGQSFQGHKEYIIFNVGTPAHLQYHWPSPRSLGFAKLISVKVKETGNE
ncbi:glycoside hydrolase family 16 protein [Salinisphaera sp.]|uniref:glycoside hydrolase family 16 protein n=1 Tax=Salinisphaera sp. TaxID=1914330 RepID=UPI002D781D39|nr:glycoside hydrolase family 16 protein [Salinisphaera sp.]HET7313237.1 glycoside hydrolase family 16 protein [Salinisphaera sp.]